MNEEIEYAEMLEIPVSTVNIVKKKRGKKRKNQDADLQESVIEKINDKMQTPETEIRAEADLFAEGANSDGRVDFHDDLERIDTVRLYSEDEKRRIWEQERLRANDVDLDVDYENEVGRYEAYPSTRSA